jgi:TIR domain
MALWDAFICHASDDKREVAQPIADLLRAAGYRIWLDEYELVVGDSLRQRIDEGLASSRYGVVILSPAFFGKSWPQRELDGLAARESDHRKVILPVWHGVDRDEVAARSPMLADRLGVSTALGMSEVVARLSRALGRGGLPRPGGDGRPAQPEAAARAPRAGASLLTAVWSPWPRRAKARWLRLLSVVIAVIAIATVATSWREIEAWMGAMVQAVYALVAGALSALADRDESRPGPRGFLGRLLLFYRPRRTTHLWIHALYYLTLVMAAASCSTALSNWGEAETPEVLLSGLAFGLLAALVRAFAVALYRQTG